MSSILAKYRYESEDTARRDKRGAGVVGLLALGCLGYGVFGDHPAASIAGGALIGGLVLGDYYTLARSFMEAKLDYMKNGRFTKLE